MTTLETICATPEGRALLLVDIATTEDAAVTLVDEIRKGLPEGQLRKLADKHREDEQRHAERLYRRLGDLGIVPDAEQAMRTTGALMGLYGEMAPETASERYQVLQVIEEDASTKYAEVASALRPHDPDSAALFDSMVHDEASHIRYCQAATRELGGRSKLSTYREIFAHRIEAYDPSRHFDEIESWAGPLSRDELGTGLVIPGRCCGFAGVISGTRTAYFYGLRANPQIGQVTRGRSILRLARALLRSVQGAGITKGLTSTSNPVVFKFWAERMNFQRVNDVLLEGAL